MTVQLVLPLEQIGDAIRETWADTRAHQIGAWEGYFRVGGLLLEARRQMPSDRQFGGWFKRQEFGFSRQWSSRLMRLASSEGDVRLLLESALSSSDEPPGVDVVVKRLTSSAMQERDTDARVIELGSGTDAGDRFRLINGEFQSADVDDASVDLIVTDPPYPEEFAHLWDDLADFAARVLKPGGIVAAMSGKIHLPARMASLERTLQYGWVYAQLLPGDNTRILARHVAQEWKPWLCYSNGPWPSGRVEWHGDLLADAPLDKTHYHWQQSTTPAESLIRQLCPVDGVVVDPFMGSGSYGVAALNAGRRFIGIEADANRYQVSLDRVNAA